MLLVIDAVAPIILFTKVLKITNTIAVNPIAFTVSIILFLVLASILSYVWIGWGKKYGEEFSRQTEEIGKEIDKKFDKKVVY